MLTVSVQNSPIEHTTRSQLCTLKRNAEAVVDLLPGPAVPFTYAAGLSGPVRIKRPQPLHSQLRDAGHIEVVETVPVSNCHDRQVYAVPAPVHEQAVRYLSAGYSPCPCGHRGLHNRADGAGYECGWSRCDKVFSRSEVDA